MNGLISPLKFIYESGENISIECNEGYVMHTSNNGESLKCLPDGSWSSKVPECKKFTQI